MIRKDQIEKLKATGKVDDVENEGMDKGRFFVHLNDAWTWNMGYGEQHTASFGSFTQAWKAVNNNPTKL